MMNRANALNQYRQVGAAASVQDASPHRLVEILMESVLQKISAAKGFMERRQIAEKGKHIGWAISIVETLRASLNKEVGGEIAENLEGLYDYLEHRLLEANLRNDPEKLDEAAQVMGTLLEGWKGIPPAQRHIGQQVETPNLVHAGV